MKDLSQYISKLSYRFNFNAEQYTKDEGWSREKLALVAIYGVPSELADEIRASLDEAKAELALSELRIHCCAEMGIAPSRWVWPEGSQAWKLHINAERQEIERENKSLRKLRKLAADHRLAP